MHQAVKGIFLINKEMGRNIKSKRLHLSMNTKGNIYRFTWNR